MKPSDFHLVSKTARILAFSLLLSQLATCGGKEKNSFPHISFTSYTFDVRSLNMEDVPTPFLTGFDSRGTPVILGNYEVIDGVLVDRAAAARAGRILHPELCIEKDPMYPWSSSNGWPAMVLDGSDVRFVAQQMGRYLTAWRWWFEIRRDWDASELVARDFGFAILYGSSAAFPSEAAFPLFLVSDYFDRNTNTARVAVSRISSPSDEASDLGGFEGLDPHIAWVPSENMLYLAHRTYSSPCELRRWDGISWDNVVGPPITAGGACVGLATAGDGTLLMVAQNQPAPDTTELRAYRRDGNSWQDAGRIGPEFHRQLLGITVQPAGDGLVVSHVDPDAGVEFWAWDGADAWSRIATVGHAGLSRVSWTAGPDGDLFAAFIDDMAGGLPRLMRLPLDAAPEDLGTAGVNPASYVHLTLDPADQSPIVLLDAAGSEHPHACKRSPDGTFADLGEIWGAGDAPWRSITDAQGELAFLQFSPRGTYIRKEDIRFRDVECLGFQIPDAENAQGYATLGHHWMALDPEGRLVLAAVDQSQGGVPVAFRIDTPGQWTFLGNPGSDRLVQDSRDELHLAVKSDGAPAVMTVILDPSDPYRSKRANVHIHAGDTQWENLDFTSPEGLAEARLGAFENDLFVSFAAADPADGSFQVAVARHARGKWQTLGPFSPAGENAGRLWSFANGRGQVFLSYLTNDTPFTWMYVLAAWNGDWHQLGYVLQGDIEERLANVSMMPTPDGLPAFSMLESSEYNLDLWLYLPNK